MALRRHPWGGKPLPDLAGPAEPDPESTAVDAESTAVDAESSAVDTASTAAGCRVDCSAIRSPLESTWSRPRRTPGPFGEPRPPGTSTERRPLQAAPAGVAARMFRTLNVSPEPRMISFEPTDDQKMVRDSVAQFAERTLRPRIREFERARGLPDDVLAAAHAMGLPLAAFPEAVGGAGLGVVTQVLLEEELAQRRSRRPPSRSAGPARSAGRRCSSAARSGAKALLAPFAGDGAHTRFGAVAWGERQVSRERPGLVTTARSARARAGRSTGEKSYVLNADRAESFVVFAQVDAVEGLATASARSSSPRTRRGCSVLAARRRRSASTRRASAGSRSTASRSPTTRGSRTAATRGALAVASSRSRRCSSRRAASGLARAAFDIDARLRRAAQGVRQADRALPGRRLHARRPRDGRRGRARAASGARRAAGTPSGRDDGRADERDALLAHRAGASPSRTRPRCAAATTPCSSTAARASCATTPSRSDARREAAAALRDDRRARRPARGRARARRARSIPALVLPGAESQNVFV